MNTLNISPRGSGKSISIIHKLRAEQAKVDKRRDVVNKIKESLVLQFQNKVALLHNKNAFDSEYNDKDFCKDMTETIEYFQKKLDALKIDGQFYLKNVVEDKEEIFRMNVNEEELKEDN